MFYLNFNLSYCLILIVRYLGLGLIIMTWLCMIYRRVSSKDDFL